MKIVILKGGKGKKKKKYNGSKAKLVRRKGGWIAAKLVADGTTVKWRGKSFDFVFAAPSAAAITLDTMPSDVMSHILSFLFSSGRDPNDAGWDVVAPTLNSILRVNSQLTQKLIATVFPKTRFCANLLHLSGWEVFPILVGLTTCPFAFQSIQITAGSGDFGFLASLFLHHFNMTKIETLTLKHPGTCAGRFVLRPQLEYYIEIDVDAPHEDSASDTFPIPAAFKNMTAASFQKNTIGTFRTLKTLRLFVMDFGAFNDDDNFLMQLPVLRKLDLAVKPHRRQDNYGVGFGHLAKFISNAHLEHFVFRGVSQYHSGSHMAASRCFTEHFELRSATLRTFSMPANCMTGFFVRKCVCPKLERFACRGFAYGNGVRPNDPLLGWANVSGFPLRIPPRDVEGKREYLVANQSFYGMEVPPTCVVVFFE